MDINWQYNNPANPADAAIGPQIYDNHLYYSLVLNLHFKLGLWVCADLVISRFGVTVLLTLMRVLR
jgi:hypothetical protein